MTRLRLSWPLCLAIVLLAGCSREDSLLPTPKEQARLDSHIDNIFAGVDVEDEEQFDADYVRVDDVHQIAYLAEKFKDRTGYYPLAIPDSMVFRQTLLGFHGDVTNFGKTWVEPEELLALLRKVLGPDVELPEDPLPDDVGSRTYAYSVYGTNYTCAAMLYHPVGWSEGILQRQWQYRVGGIENMRLPILEARKLLAGGYEESSPARSSDPLMLGEASSH